MALKLSTGLVNFLAGGGSLRKVFEDCVYRVWEGTPPATADLAATGDLLCEVTLASGSVVSGSTDRSTPTVYAPTIAAPSYPGTVKVNITVDSVGPTTYTYTILAADDNAVKIAVKVARMLNDIPQIQAIADPATGVMYVASRIAGLDFTLATGGGTFAVTPNLLQTAGRMNTLTFGLPVIGVIPKPTGDIWSGKNLLTGVAGYGRFCLKSDADGDLSTAVRIQLTIATSGADMNMSNTTLTQNATLTIDSGNFTEPKSA